MANFKEPQQQQQQQSSSSTTAANVGCGDLTKNPFSSSFIPPPGKSNEVKTSSRMVGLNDCILRQDPQKISFYKLQHCERSELHFYFLFEFLRQKLFCYIFTIHNSNASSNPRKMDFLRKKFETFQT